jgi:hypothetical protein
MSDQRETWSPPPDWQGDIEIELRASGGSRTLTLSAATRGDWDGVEAALAEAAGRHAYAKGQREIAMRRRESPKPRRRPPGTGAAEADEEPEPGHTGPSTGHS